MPLLLMPCVIQLLVCVGIATPREVIIVTQCEIESAIELIHGKLQYRIAKYRGCLFVLFTKYGTIRILCKYWVLIGKIGRGYHRFVFIKTCYNYLLLRYEITADIHSQWHSSLCLLESSGSSMTAFYF